MKQVNGKCVRNERQIGQSKIKEKGTDVKKDDTLTRWSSSLLWDWLAPWCHELAQHNYVMLLIIVQKDKDLDL